MENIKVGDEFNVYVLRVDNDEGHLILSKKRADKSKALDFLEDALEEKDRTGRESCGELLKVDFLWMLKEYAGLCLLH